MKKCLLILAALIFFASAKGATTLTRLKGHLSQERLTHIFPLIKKAAEEPGSTFVIELNSTSGNLGELLKLSKELYEAKEVGNLRVILYIDDNALGPAALLPFVADELYSSHFVSWGDIPLGTGEQLPTNILRNKAVSLISPKQPRHALLQLMAAAMSDPNLVVVDERGKWRALSNGEKAEEGRVISRKGETLVVSHNQLKELKLVKETLASEAFLSRYKSEQTTPSQGELQEIKSALAVPKKSFERELQERIVPNAEGNNRVGHILIADRTSGISQSTWLYVKSALDSYKAMKPPPLFVILELNTPGGEVFSSQQISDALKSLDINNNIPVVAYINNWAISAGAMLAYSSRFITVVKDGSMGAAEPVLAGEGGEMKSASEKVNSALRTDFANRARFFDRNPDIAEAMVDKEIILVFRHGKIVRLNKEEQIVTKGPNPDIVISAEGKLLTLNAKQLIDYGVADTMVLPAKLEPVTEEERVKGEWPLSKMLIGQLPYFKEKIPNATVESYIPDWRTRFFIFLAMPLVSSLLMLGLLLGFYLEVNSPGFGLPGALAAVCLLLIVISNLSLEIANWLEVIFLLSGALLILIDLFVLPSGGILLFIGGVFCIGGLFAIMLPAIGSIDYEFETQTFNAGGELFFERLAWLSGTIVIAFVIMVLLGRYIKPSFAGIKRFVLLGHEQDASEGFIAGDKPEELPQPGSEGEVLATLRPAGKVMIGGTIYEAVTDGAFISKGEAVVVDKLDGSVIVVTRAKGESETS